MFNDLDELPNLPEPEEEEITRETLWRTQEGRKVAIKDMTDSHLLNTIRVLRGQSRLGTVFSTTKVRRRQWINTMANEAYSRSLSLDELNEKDPVHE